VDTNKDTSTEPTSEIRITGLDRDKTRKTDTTDARYQVYFELSKTPQLAWKTIFEREWKALNLTQPRIWFEADVDNKFIIMHCFLAEVASTYLPLLKKAVDATNSAYTNYLRDEATEHQRRIDAWTQERKAVDDMADSLQFK
jgi:hypothetical protein